jgi:hypothetical protein
LETFIDLELPAARLDSFADRCSVATFWINQPSLPLVLAAYALMHALRRAD